MTHSNCNNDNSTTTNDNTNKWPGASMRTYAAATDTTACGGKTYCAWYMHTSARMCIYIYI